MDPLERLDDDCLRILLSYLTPIDIVRAELVSQSWARRLRWWMVDSGIRLHFRYAWKALNREGPTSKQYKRLAFQEQALPRGEPTSVRKFPNAHHFAIAGDWAVCAIANAQSACWQLLGRVGRSKELNLQSVSRRDRHNVLLDVDLNADGYLFLRIGDSNRPTQCRDVVYSLVDRKMAWGRDYATGDPPLIPLLIGRERVYFGRRTPENGYDLVAYEIHTQVLLYQVPLIAKILSDDRHGIRRNRQDVLEFIQQGDDELIIQFDSNRLMSYDERNPPRKLAIINSRNGQVIQQIAWDGFRRGPTVARSSSSTLVLIDSADTLYSTEPQVDFVAIQTFSRQLDGSFVRTGVQMVTAPTETVLEGRFVVHPFTFQAVAVCSGETPKAVTLSRRDHLMTNTVGQEALPGVTVDEYYDMTAVRELTLPPYRGARGGDRRKCPVTVDWWHNGSLVWVDNRRLIFEHSWESQDHAIYLYDFRPKW